MSSAPRGDHETKPTTSSYQHPSVYGGPSSVPTHGSPTTGNYAAIPTDQPLPAGALIVPRCSFIRQVVPAPVGWAAVVSGSRLLVGVQPPIPHESVPLKEGAGKPPVGSTVECQDPRSADGGPTVITVLGALSRFWDHRLVCHLDTLAAVALRIARQGNLILFLLDQDPAKSPLPVEEGSGRSVQVGVLDMPDENRVVTGFDGLDRAAFQGGVGFLWEA